MNRIDFKINSLISYIYCKSLLYVLFFVFYLFSKKFFLLDFLNES